jgi:hypothetical protein
LAKSSDCSTAIAACAAISSTICTSLALKRPRVFSRTIVTTPIAASRPGMATQTMFTGRSSFGS